MKTIRLLTLLAAFPLAVAGDTIRPAAIRAHMAFLADDLLEGRALVDGDGGEGGGGVRAVANYRL